MNKKYTALLTENLTVIDFTEKQSEHIRAIIQTGGSRLGIRAILLLYPDLRLKTIGGILQYVFFKDIVIYRQKNNINI